MKTIRALVLTLFLVPLAAAPVLSQQAEPEGARIADANAFEAAVTAHERPAERTRSALAELLSRDEVQTLAAERGIPMDRVQDAAATLSDRELARVAPLVSEANAALQERITITISAVTIIIILLLLILLT